MDIEQAEKEFPELNLYVLSRNIKLFLTNPGHGYSFVKAVYLYTGYTTKYHLVFEIPPDVESRLKDIEKSFEREHKYDNEMFQDSFRVDNEDARPELFDELKAYKDFKNKIDLPPIFHFDFDGIYKVKETFSEDRLLNEWNFWVVTDAKDIAGQGLNDFIMPNDDPVYLYTLDAVKSESSPELDISVPPTQVTDIKLNNFFHKNGDMWHVGFNGRDTNIKHVNGIAYIAYILEKPNESISCIELYIKISGDIPDNSIPEAAIKKAMG